MRPPRAHVVALAALALTACGGGAQEARVSQLVRSSDPGLAELAAALLPDLARRSGMELREPVRIEKRTREELVSYLEGKLDEDLSEDEARVTVEAYALLGLASEGLDLRELLLGLYTEQVAGFYEPDSTTLFILDDQPASSLQGLLVHELVHAVQDQTVDLAALTDPGMGNDPRVAAQAAIEGHATLVMLEYLTEQMQGGTVDLSRIPDFGASLRPALEGMRSQFPALASAPPVIQESLLFPYLEGAGFVQNLWSQGERVAPFGEYLPRSTEQVLTYDRQDVPVSLTLIVEGAEVVHEDGLGRLETGVLLDTHLGAGRGALAEGWGGDRYAVVSLPSGARGLVWVTTWDDAASRDRFVEGLRGGLGGFPRAATLEPLELGAPGALLRVGVPATVRVTVEAAR